MVTAALQVGKYINLPLLLLLQRNLPNAWRGLLKRRTQKITLHKDSQNRCAVFWVMVFLQSGRRVK